MSFDSGNSSYQYVRPDNFNPNSPTGWTQFGPVTSCLYDKADNIFTLSGTPASGRSPAPVLKIYLLGPYAFRVRFNTQNDYSMDGSFAVVSKNLGVFTPNVLQNDNVKLSVNLGGIRLDVLSSPFKVQVYLGGELIGTDAGQGLIGVVLFAIDLGLGVEHKPDRIAAPKYSGAPEAFTPWKLPSNVKVNVAG